MESIGINAAQLQGSATTLSKRIEDTTIKPTSDSTANQNAISEANSYNKYDTLELSSQYVAFRTKSENAGVNSDTQQANSTVDQRLKKINDESDESDNVKKRSKQSDDQKNEDSEEEPISNNELAGYTNSELKGLVLSGKISTIAYNNEIKNRQKENDASGLQLKNPITGISSQKASNRIME